MPIGLLDAVDDSLLVECGRQDICVRCRRANKASADLCRQSGAFIKQHLPEYKCKNGLCNIAIPVQVGGQHVATFLLGQFLYEGEPPGRGLFQRQSRQFGFDEAGYLAALDRVPVFSREKVETIVAHHSALASLISDLAEEALRRQQAEARAESLARFPQEAPDPILRLASDLTILYANGAATSVLQTLGAEPPLPAPPSLAELARRALTQGRAEADIVSGSRVFSMRATAVGGEVNLYAHDITAHVRTEQALRDSEQRFFTVFHRSPFANGFTKLPEGTFADVNDEWEKLLGIPREEALGKTSLQLGIIADPQEHARVYAEARSGGCVHAEMRYITRTKGIRIVQLNADVVTLGEEQYLLGALQDITEQKRAEEALHEAIERLRESDRRKDDFLGMLSHELRNPLAPIRNSVHVLGHAGATSEQASRARTIIARQADQLTRLVEDLLDVKRISTDKLRLRLNTMDLSEQVRETVEDTRPLFAARSIALDLAAPLRPIWVNGDRTRLAQVVSNLLHNAAKFTDEGGHVGVAVEQRDGQARIRIRDDGVGIAPDMLDKLFEAFVQIDRTLHRSRGGLGLGLSLVRGIAELHGGTVTARSDGEGKGTEFIVSLPATTPALETGNWRQPPAAGSRHRVLLIEDNRDAAESLRDILEMNGHEVQVANDGETGLEAVYRHDPDVILCDLGLPAIDGYEVARRLRASEPPVRSRLVALSGYASPDDIERAIRAGFDYHVAKPPDPDALLKLVADAPGSASPGTLPTEIRTGHHEVDAQHASMLGELRRLRGAKLDAVWESLRFLQQHTSSHFGYEELLMEDVNYPEMAAHKQHHSEFLQRFHAIQQQLQNEGATPESVGSLADTIEAWVAEHILEEDLQLAEFIRSRTQPQLFVELSPAT